MSSLLLARQMSVPASAAACTPVLQSLTSQLPQAIMISCMYSLRNREALKARTTVWEKLHTGPSAKFGYSNAYTHMKHEGGLLR